MGNMMGQNNVVSPRFQFGHSPLNTLSLSETVLDAIPSSVLYRVWHTPNEDSAERDLYFEHWKKAHIEFHMSNTRPMPIFTGLSIPFDHVSCFFDLLRLKDSLPEDSTQKLEYCTTGVSPLPSWLLELYIQKKSDQVDARMISFYQLEIYLQVEVTLLDPIRSYIQSILAEVTAQLQGYPMIMSSYSHDSACSSIEMGDFVVLGAQKSYPCWSLSNEFPLKAVILNKLRQDFGITLTQLDEINPAQPNPIIFLATSSTERLSEDLSTEMTKIRELVGDSSSRKDLLIMCATGLPQIRPDEQSLAIAFLIDNRFSADEREIIDNFFKQSFLST